MPLKYQSVKQTPGKADAVVGDFFNAYIKTNRGDVATTTTINYDSNDRVSSVEVTGDIEYTAEYTYDAQNRISEIHIYFKEYIFKEHLIPDEDYDLYSSRFTNWNNDYAPSVYKNGDLITSGFTINYTNGTISFATPNQSTDDIQVSYRHTIHIKETYTYNTSQTIITRTII